MIRAALLLGLLALVPSEVDAAAQIYQRQCAVCHGSAGRGDGPAAGLLAPRPRDFTVGVYKFRSTPSGSLPALDDVVATIRRGLPGTSMAAYGTILTPDEIQGVARFVLSLAPPTSRVGPAIALDHPPADSPEARLRGAALYEQLACAGCHGRDGHLPSWRPPREGPGGPAPPADLREPWAFRGGHEAGDIARRILTGLDGSTMPGFAGAITARDAWNIAYHVRSLARRPAWSETDPGAVATAGVSDPLDRGRYLTNAMLCPLCHTPISPRDGSYDTARFLAGGMRVSAYPWGVWYSRNLTADADTGLGRWSEDEIVRAVTRGIARDGRRLDPMAMPWPWFSQLTPDDARAIAVYLKALPAISNAVPLPRYVPAPEAVGGKLLSLLGAETAVEFWGGNAATEPALREGAPAAPGWRLAAWLLGAATLALGAGGLLRALVGRRRRALGLVGGAVILSGWAALAIWPPLGVMNPELTIRWLFLGTPALPASLDGPGRALAERGRYVATVAPCGLCHTPAGAFVGFYTGRTLAGGMEARWRVYGRAVSSNLSPHPEHGVATLPDDVLLRGMRSGIGRDGRAMHWQAMPWDIGSHWSEEDQRALLAYLRTLPPVSGVVPAPRGPRPDDPPADAFYFGDAARR